ncbi:STAS-like domain-containing protein [Microbacterium album]|uniref:HTH merR-type domain-containing protein n=1 Tax=Microbacterium album TaxID=2053191 RepID=A0A917IIW0_9MICO|nr:DUF4325 domain-containing protein [Microbacterium album]GGH48708.1 hypothetical protein GCM10010921_26380 [Microbacterium album]
MEYPSLLTIGEAARMLGVSVKVLRSLADRGAVRSSRTPGGHRRFHATQLREDWSRATTPQTPPLSSLPTGDGAIEANSETAGSGTMSWTRTYPLRGLSEDTVWLELRRWLETQVGELPRNAREILAYAVTEIVNNAIDHSRGTYVEVTARLAGRRAEITARDDGVGAFATLRDGLGLPDVAAAVVEITKGKRTTAPDRHAGEGLFFTSKAVDVFDLQANGYRLAVDNTIDDIASGSSDASGTVARVLLSLDTERSLREVFERHTDDDLAFVKTAPVIKLISREGEFISRSEAKRFATGLEKFTEVTLDFEGLDLVGQGFADELFRVWRREHPDVTLRVVNASPGVALMIGRVDRSLVT